MKYHLEYTNGQRFSIAKFLKDTAKTQSIEAWKKEHGDYWHIEYKTWLQYQLAGAISNLELIITS